MPCPTVHKSAAVEGCNIDGPGPENPPPIAIIIMLTLTPNTPRIPNIKRACRLGDNYSEEYRYGIFIPRQKQKIKSYYSRVDNKDVTIA